MPYLKVTPFKMCAAISLLFIALPVMAAAADKVIDVTKAGVVSTGATTATATVDVLRSEKEVRVWPQAALEWLHKIGIR